MLAIFGGECNAMQMLRMDGEHKMILYRETYQLDNLVRVFTSQEICSTTQNP